MATNGSTPAPRVRARPRGRRPGPPAPGREGPRRTRLGPAFRFWLVLPLGIAVAVLAPLAVGSLGRYLYHRTLADQLYRLTPPATPTATYTHLHVQIFHLDELSQQVTLRVSGNHVCDGCKHQTRVVFSAVPAAGAGREGLPPQAAITLPAASDRVTADLQLPIDGDVMAYPFDRYVLRLGLGLELLPPPAAPDGPNVPEPLSPVQATGRLLVSLEEQVPQVDVSLLAPVQQDNSTGAAAGPAGAGAPAYLAVNDIRLERPLYLKVEVVLLVALVAAGAVYGALLQPLGDVFTKVGGLVLGVWGIRSLMLSSLPPYATAVDAVLTLVILTVLSAVVMRLLYRLHDRADLHLLPGRRGRRAAARTAPAPRRWPSSLPTHRSRWRSRGATR